MKYNSFGHVYRKYDKEKVQVFKTFDENGNVDEYKYFYNNAGKLLYSIYKNPRLWKRIDERSWGTVYMILLGMFIKISLMNMI